MLAERVGLQLPPSEFFLTPGTVGFCPITLAAYTSRSPTLPTHHSSKIITMSILKLRSALAPLSVRRFATAAPSVSVTSTRSNASAPILGNIEASWKTLPAEEQYEVYQQLEQLQKKNWKELTIDEKKAGELSIYSF